MSTTCRLKLSRRGRFFRSHPHAVDLLDSCFLVGLGAVQLSRRGKLPRHLACPNCESWCSLATSCSAQLLSERWCYSRYGASGSWATGCPSIHLTSAEEDWSADSRRVPPMLLADCCRLRARFVRSRFQTLASMRVYRACHGGRAKRRCDLTVRSRKPCVGSEPLTKSAVPAS
jgi:hypothetical protein